MKGYDEYVYFASYSDRNVCDVNLEIPDLKEGEYIIYSCLSGRNPKEEATISCYCETAVQLTPVTTIKND